MNIIKYAFNIEIYKAMLMGGGACAIEKQF